MPFTYDGRLVSCLLQQLGEGLLASVKRLRIVCEAVFMAVLACQQTSPARSAQRVGYKAVGETHAFGRNPVDVRRLDKTAVVRTDGLIGMVVAHDIENIHGLLAYCVRTFFILTCNQRHAHGRAREGKEYRVVSNLFHCII